MCKLCYSTQKCSVNQKSYLKDLSTPKTSVASVKSSPFCQKYPEEMLKLYCQDCEVLVCRDCVLVTHKSHNYSFVDDVIEDEKQQLKDVTLQELDKIMMSTTEAINGVEKMQANVLSHNDQHIAQLNTTFQKITHMVNKRKKKFWIKSVRSLMTLCPLCKNSKTILPCSRETLKNAVTSQATLYTMVPIVK